MERGNRRGRGNEKRAGVAHSLFLYTDPLNRLSTGKTGRPFSEGWFKRSPFHATGKRFLKILFLAPFSAYSGGQA
jgi:hypothetical protein